VCRNLSEGFERQLSGEIVQFFRYALASLAEVQDHLEECRTRTLIDSASFDRIWDLSEHAKATAINFKKVHEAKVQSQRRQRRRRRNSPDP
jgi:four helix bundle protein